MQIMRKLPGFQRSPHGLEWKILRKTPIAFFYSGVVIGIFTLVAHWLPPQGPVDQVTKHLQLVDIMAIASLITVWTAIFTVAVGAFVVYMMKGPAYVADALDVPDSDEPHS